MVQKVVRSEDKNSFSIHILNYPNFTTNGGSAPRRDRSVHKGSTLLCSRALTVHAPLPNRQHKERVHLLPLNNAGRDERTF